MSVLSLTKSGKVTSPDWSVLQRRTERVKQFSSELSGLIESNCNLQQKSLNKLETIYSDLRDSAYKVFLLLPPQSTVLVDQKYDNLMKLATDTMISEGGFNLSNINRMSDNSDNNEVKEDITEMSNISSEPDILSDTVQAIPVKTIEETSIQHEPVSVNISDENQQLLQSIYSRRKERELNDVAYGPGQAGYYGPAYAQSANSDKLHKFERMWIGRGLEAAKMNKVSEGEKSVLLDQRYMLPKNGFRTLSSMKKYFEHDDAKIDPISLEIVIYMRSFDASHPLSKLEEYQFENRYPNMYAILCDEKYSSNKHSFHKYMEDLNTALRHAYSTYVSGCDKEKAKQRGERKKYKDDITQKWYNKHKDALDRGAIKYDPYSIFVKGMMENLIMRFCIDQENSGFYPHYANYKNVVVGNAWAHGSLYNPIVYMNSDDAKTMLRIRLTKNNSIENITDHLEDMIDLCVKYNVPCETEDYDPKVLRAIAIQRYSQRTYLSKLDDYSSRTNRSTAVSYLTNAFLTDTSLESYLKDCPFNDGNKDYYNMIVPLGSSFIYFGTQFSHQPLAIYYMYRLMRDKFPHVVWESTSESDISIKDMIQSHSILGFSGSKDWSVEDFNSWGETFENEEWPAISKILKTGYEKYFDLVNNHPDDTQLYKAKMGYDSGFTLVRAFVYKLDTPLSLYMWRYTAQNVFRSSKCINQDENRAHVNNFYGGFVTDREVEFAGNEETIKRIINADEYSDDIGIRDIDKQTVEAWYKQCCPCCRWFYYNIDPIKDKLKYHRYTTERNRWKNRMRYGRVPELKSRERKVS